MMPIYPVSFSAPQQAVADRSGPSSSRESRPHPSRAGSSSVTTKTTSSSASSSALAPAAAVNATPVPPASSEHPSLSDSAASSTSSLSSTLASPGPSAHDGSRSNPNYSSSSSSAPRGKMQAWSPPSSSSNYSSRTASRAASGSGIGSTNNAVDISLEDVYVYVSPQSVSWRAAKRRDREASETSLTSGKGEKPPLRERSSFMNLNKILPGSSPSAGTSSASPMISWRRATLRLTEHTSEIRPTSRILQIQEDDHTTVVHLHNLMATDVRLVHRSLFHLRDVFGIYNCPSSTQLTTFTYEPIFIHFPQRTTMSTWFSLLMACTKPEIHGSQLAPISYGGLFRVWRGVELGVIEGRNIGLPSHSSSSSSALPHTHTSHRGGTPYGYDLPAPILAGVTDKELAKKEASSTLKQYAKTGFGGGANPLHVLLSHPGAPSGDGVDWAGNPGEIKARNKASVKSFGSSSGSGNGKGKGFGTNSGGSAKFRDRDKDEDPGLSRIEDDLFCAIYLAGQLVACTSIQGDSPYTAEYSIEATPKWGEAFSFDNLPASAFGDEYEGRDSKVEGVGNLSILVYRASSKKGALERLVQGKKNDNRGGGGGSSGVHLDAPTGGPGSGPSMIGSPLASIFDMRQATSQSSIPLGPLLFDSASSGSPFNLLGQVTIPLAPFRRGEMLDGHWPIVASRPRGDLPGDDDVSSAPGTIAPSGVIAGELRLKLRIDEHMILPLERYDALHDVLKSMNSVRLATELERHLGRTPSPALLPGVGSTVSRDVMRLSYFREVFLADVQSVLADEIAECARTGNPLFRSTTPASIFAQYAMFSQADEYLRRSVGGVVHRIIEGQVAFETDRKYSTSEKEVTSGIVQLVRWSREMWTSIYNARDECPTAIRGFLAFLRAEVDACYTESPERKRIKELRLQPAIAFCFLRLIIPAILDPYIYQISHVAPTPTVRRSLLQIARVIQQLANSAQTASEDRRYSEENQRPLAEFLASNKPAMEDYLRAVTEPKIAAFNPGIPESPLEGHVLALKQLSANLTGLHRESVSDDNLFLFEQPRTLASLSAAIVRRITLHPSSISLHSFPLPPGAVSSDPGSLVREVTTRALELEREVAGTVTRLEMHTSSNLSRTRSGSASSSSTSSSMSAPFQPFALSPSSSQFSIPSSRRPSLTALRFASSTSGIATNPSDMAPISPLLSEHDPSYPHPQNALDIPINPLEAYHRTTHTQYDIPSFPASSFESAKGPDSSAARSLTKSPSRGELSRSATRKRSGFLRTVLPGKRDD